MLKLVIPPPIYMLLFAVGMWVLDRYIPLLEIVPEILRSFGLVLIALAVFMDLWSLGLFLMSRTTPNPMKPDKTSKLVISGLYRFSRNPMYLGLLIILTGWAIYLGHLTAFFLLPLFVLTLNIQQIKPEEKMLEQKFGESYLHYKNRVRRWI